MPAARRSSRATPEQLMCHLLYDRTRWVESRRAKGPQFDYASHGTIPVFRTGVRGTDTMPTNVIDQGSNSAASHDGHNGAQKVLIVNGGSEVLELLETVLDAGHYDIVFVEATAHAYSQIKKVQPNLVILCVHLDDVDGCQVLSMLKLDDETRGIPVLTYATEEQPEDDEEEPDTLTDEMFTFTPPLRMN
jgi:CheY-like chemotaxis protein